MGRRCVVLRCQNSKCNYKERITCRIHAFPANSEIRGSWVRASVPEGFKSKLENYGVCQLHFFDADYADESKIRLVKHAVPSRNIPDFQNLAGVTWNS